MLEVKQAEFIKSSSDLKQCPESSLPEFAFIGRSNVGKSSIINMITGRKSLARTSATPGKTRLINHFSIDNAWLLVDLPGYGFAKISRTEREKWTKMIQNYLTGRKNLKNVFLLIDSRVEPQKNDIEFMQWLNNNKLPFTLIFTKSDKLTQKELMQNLKIYKAELMNIFNPLPLALVTSAKLKKGRPEILSLIEELIEKQ